MSVTVPRAEIRFEFAIRNDGETTLIVTTPLISLPPFVIVDPCAKAASLNSQMPTMLTAFRMLAGRRSPEISFRDADAALYQLNNVAWQVAGILFGGTGGAQDFMTSVGAAIAAAFARATSDWRSWPIVNVIKDEAEPIGWAIPFEIFPFAAPFTAVKRDPPQFECFLGLRAPIVRASRIGRERLARDDAGRVRTLFLSTREKLPGVSLQRQFFRDHDHVFSTIEWPGPHQVFPYPPLPEIGQLWRGDHEIIHLACHYGDAPHYPHAFDFGDDCSVPAGALGGDLLQFSVPNAPRPFVFLNACNTASVNDPYAAILGRLEELGYLDIIGSRSLLPDRIAGEFARSLYRWMLSDEEPSLADAVVLARRELLEMQNPAGLLYVHYGSHALRMDPAPVTPPAQVEIIQKSWFSRLSDWAGFSRR